MLNKQGYNMSFGQGLDTKTDPFQVQAGKMLSLQNAVFDRGALQKRNGFGQLTTLTNTTSTTISTYNGNLVSMGNTFQAYSTEAQNWLSQGVFQPLSLTVVPAVRSASFQSACDVAVASNNLACVVYSDSVAGYCYQLVDATTGQVIVSQTALPTTATQARAFSLGTYLVITFGATVAGSPHLQYIAIPSTNPTNPGAATDISTQISSITAAYDGYSTGTKLFLSWNGNDGGGAIRTNFIDSALNLYAVKTIPGKTANLLSVTVDSTSGAVWVTWWENATNNGWMAAYDQFLNALLVATQVLNTVPNLTNITSAAYSGVNMMFYQTNQNYSYVATRSDYISNVSCTIGGVAGATAVVLRGVGLASKSFYYTSNAKRYMLVAYGGTFQPTYLLIDQAGNVVAKLAYSNGGGYVSTQVLSGVNLSGTTIQVAYLIKDLITPVNRTQGVAAVSGIYSQVGVNIADMNFSTNGISTVEAGQSLQLMGGFMWQYDGVKAVEQNFHVWPEDLKVTTSAAGGSISAQQYYYIALYAWTDAQGVIHRSAPSVPYGIVTTGATSTNTINVPYLRQTYKVTPNKARIELYRWSTAQQTYYLVNSITSPTQNDTTADSVAITDTLADASILGNLILYTTGGIVEDISPPACTSATLYKSRLVLLDAEDTNLLWYSKTLAENTPVEMSDLFTFYIGPLQSSGGASGPNSVLSVLDDKLIIFKRNAIAYMVGNGPDNTGANNDFSEPALITSTVGCSNFNSIVSIPSGLMFQSNKGIWLLGRDLSTSYIGAAVEQYNGDTVLSAVAIPGTNQVRFTLDSGTTLMYDYFFGQWGTFSNIPAVSSTIYNSLHTYLNSSGQVFQETIGAYLDGGSPVLLSVTTAWIKMTGLQGFQRAYWMYLLGMYFSPHKLGISIAYDYNSAATQITTITPTNFNPNYGADPLYGSSSPYGGNSQIEQWRLFFQQQKCEAFQITIQEIYDPSHAVGPGYGLSLSGLNFVIGAKSTYPRLAASNYAG